MSRTRTSSQASSRAVHRWAAVSAHGTKSARRRVPATELATQTSSGNLARRCAVRCGRAHRGHPRPREPPTKSSLDAVAAGSLISGCRNPSEVNLPLSGLPAEPG